MSKKEDLKNTATNHSTTLIESDIPDIKLPEDKGNIVYLLMFLFGVGSLLPWNAILTSIDFFKMKLIGYKPDFIFGFAVNGLNFFVQVFIIIWGNKISYNIRVSVAFLILAVLMISLPLTVNALGPDAGMAACMTILVVFGMFSGLAQGSVFGLGGMLPNKYMGALMFGQGFSGVVINFIRACCLIGFPTGDPNNEFKGALIYFILAALILVACSVGHLIFQKMPFVIYYIRKASEQKEKSFRRISMAAGENEVAEDDDSPLLGNDPHINTKYDDMTSHNTQNIATGHHSHAQPEVKHSALVTFLIMMRNAFVVAWKFLVGLAFVFVITFIVFPGVSIDTRVVFLEYIEPKSLMESWKVLMFIIVFNVTDTIARFMGGQKWATMPDTFVIVGIYSRIIFFIFFTLIAFNVAPSWLFGDNADWFKVLNMIGFAFTNGFFSTQCAVKGPSQAPDDSKEIVGTFVGVFITLGILIGSILSIGMGAIVPNNF